MSRNVVFTPSARTEGLGVPQRSRLAARLAEGHGVSCDIAGIGHLHMDRPLPFICVYRRPQDRSDAGTARLITAESAHLVADSPKLERARLEVLLEDLVELLASHFGGFLLLELWSRPRASGQKPAFRLVRPRDRHPERVVKRLRSALRDVRLGRKPTSVDVSESADPSPPGMEPLLPAATRQHLGCALLGLEVLAAYQKRDGSSVYPLALRNLRRSFSHALKRGLFEFLRGQTTFVMAHHLGLGPSVLSEVVRGIDRELAEIDGLFDFLLQVTPVNYQRARHQFAMARGERAPAFVYRPCSVDPDLVKRRLYELHIENIEDPVVEELFIEKREELARKLTLLGELDTPRFLYGSLQLFGPVPQDLVPLAHQLLETLPRSAHSAHAADAAALAAAARAELSLYGKIAPWMTSRVEVVDGVIGLTVSKGNLLVGETTRVPAGRVTALIAHEVGTHIVTYVNGQRQPIRLLALGLVGYDELQEALAVFAEYLVGGLTADRLRVLAARVVGARALSDGASFVDTFRLLSREQYLDWDTAFQVTARLYRGGGLVKDAIYLRGLVRLANHLVGGRPIEPLYTGKFALEHLPLIEELRYRDVLKPPALLPWYLSLPAARARLQRVRTGARIVDFVQEER